MSTKPSLPGVVSFPEAALGNTSYLVDAGDGCAVSVDPPRDVTAHRAAAAAAGLSIAAVLETHLHADFVGGGIELAGSGATVYASRDAGVAYPHRGIGAGDQFQVGHATFTVVGTPGHTPEHLAYGVQSGGGSGVFSGGSLIVGGAARTDLSGTERTEQLAREQFRSLKLLADLDSGTALFPTHGAGSFCSTGASERAATTIGDERTTNPLLQIDDEDAFVRHLLGGFGSFPPYFLSLRAVNRAGPAMLSSLPPVPTLDPADVLRMVRGGVMLIDGRPLETWAAGYPAGAASIAIRPEFASWLGWVVPFGQPFVVLAEDDQRDQARSLAALIGYDAFAGFLGGGPGDWRDAGFDIDYVPLLSVAEAADAAQGGAALLDVRQDSEWRDGRIPGARHIELGDIAAGALPPEKDVITYCGHGERSATAASLLAARGLRVASLVGGIGAWSKASLPIER